VTNGGQNGLCWIQPSQAYQDTTLHRRPIRPGSQPVDRSADPAGSGALTGSDTCDRSGQESGSALSKKGPRGAFLVEHSSENGQITAPKNRSQKIRNFFSSGKFSGKIREYQNFFFKKIHEKPERKNSDWLENFKKSPGDSDVFHKKNRPLYIRPKKTPGKIPES
jgi:hypothetical protein